MPGRPSEVLAARRLLTVSATHAEVAHEALLREWPRLRGWLDDDEAGRRLRRHLVPAAAAWLSAARDPGELYRGQRLTAALDFMAEHGDDLTDLEREFLRAGRDAADADAAARRRSHRRLRGLAAGLAVVLLVALGAGWVALDRRNESARLAVAADVRALRAAALGEDRWDLALLYAAQAYRIERSAQSHAALLRTVHRSPEATAMYTTDQRLLALAVSADGQTLAGLGSAGTVYVWDLETGSADVDRVGPDGARGGLARPQPGRAVPRRRRHPGGCRAVRLPAAAHGRSTWTRRRSRPCRTWGGPGITAARFTSDGRTVATVGIDGLVREVDVRTGHMERGQRRRGSPISDATALDAPTGRRFMAAADPRRAGRVTAWDADERSGRLVVRGGQRHGRLDQPRRDGAGPRTRDRIGGAPRPRHRCTPRRAVRPSRRARGPRLGARRVLVRRCHHRGHGRRSGTPRPLEPRSVLRGHSGTVSQVVHSADGASLYASGFDGAVVAWDLTGTRGVVRGAGTPTPAERFGSFPPPTGVLAANGSVAVSYRDEGALELVDVRTASHRPWCRSRCPGSPARVVVDPAGRYAALLTVQWPEPSWRDPGRRRREPDACSRTRSSSSPTSSVPPPSSPATAGRSSPPTGRPSLVWDVAKRKAGRPAAHGYVARE